MTPNCKWASSTSAVSPPLFCRRSLSLQNTYCTDCSFFRPAPPMAELPSPRRRLPSRPPGCTQPTPWASGSGSQPGPQPGPVSAPGQGQALHACPSCLLIPPPLLITSTGKNKENKNSLSTLILESSPAFSVPRGCQSMCPPRGFKLFAPSVWEAPPLAPCMGGLLAIQVSP